MAPLETQPFPNPMKSTYDIAPTLGIIGGGQLAKMLAQAASQLGVRVVVLAGPDDPAAQSSWTVVRGDWRRAADIVALARHADVLTLESEFVDPAALAGIPNAADRLWPSIATMERVGDKFNQRVAIAAAKIPVPTFANAPTPDAAWDFAKSAGGRIVLKRRRLGYDGKGVAVAESEDAIRAAWTQLNGPGLGVYVEAFCPFKKELAVIATRAKDGTFVTYPVVETRQEEGVCRDVLAPAAIDARTREQALDVARRALEAVDGVGTMAVELFLTDDGVSVNELAPRVHNSGHFTIEACETSQFENHIRAILDWPLGSTRLRRPGAAMVNLLGQGAGSGRPDGLPAALGVPGAHVHIYGKSKATRNRKMGHVTALGNTADEALGLARQAAGAITFGEKERPTP